MHNRPDYRILFIGEQRSAPLVKQREIGKGEPMKRLISMAVFASCLLAIPAVVRAQDCSNLTNSDLRGTYTMSGSGYIDLSKVLPGLGMPAGPIPMYWVGAHTWNGAGGGGGWVALNAGGNMMTVQLVDVKYSMKPDCSVQASFSMKINELGVTVGPLSRLYVVAGPPWALELYMILAGTAPGTPSGPGFDGGVAHRISLQY